MVVQNFQCLDIQVFHIINSWPHSFLLNSIALLIHFLTYGGVVLLVLLYLEWQTKNPKKQLLSKLGLYAFLLINLLTEIILKFSVRRLRPYDSLDQVYIVLPKPGGFSFPSTQTALAFSLATLFLLIFPKKIVSYIILGLAILTGLGRIYMGHHYPSDVFCGAILGIFISFLLRKVVTS